MAKVEIDSAELAALKEKARKQELQAEKVRLQSKKYNMRMKLFKERALAAGIKVSAGEVDKAVKG